MATLITSGIDYARFFDDLRVVVRQEVAQAISSSAKTAPEDENGNIELAAKVLDLAKPTIYALVSKGQLPHSKRGNRLYFNRTELLAWIAEGKRNTASA
jgi:excisionase family DNA binding protein